MILTVQKVNWNEMGQPIGNESMTLAHFIGSYIRRHVPITCDNWRNKDLLNVKQGLWDEIKDENSNYSTSTSSVCTLFHRDPLLEGVCAEVIGSRVSKIIINEKIKKGEQNPVLTRLDAWEYARRNADGVVDNPVAIQVLEDVVAILDQLPEHELTNIGTDDLLARLIRLEYSERLRVVGWGITKTTLQKISSVSELSQLKNDISYLKNEIKELKSKGCKTQGVQSGGSSHMDNFDIDNFDMDNHVEEGYDGHIDVSLGEALPEGKNLGKSVCLDMLTKTTYFWCLTIFQSIYFMDPAPMTIIAKYRSLKALVEKCYECPKQLTSDGISCGYYVGCYIEDSLHSAETSIGINVWIC
ncbi:hypothetical protein OROHE_006819 [Orobanche hederae]